jgi:hypothetical protein
MTIVVTTRSSQRRDRRNWCTEGDSNSHEHRSERWASTGWAIGADRRNRSVGKWCPSEELNPDLPLTRRLHRRNASRAGVSWPRRAFARPALSKIDKRTALPLRVGRKKPAAETRTPSNVLDVHDVKQRDANAASCVTQQAWRSCARAGYGARKRLWMSGVNLADHAVPPAVVAEGMARRRLVWSPTLPLSEQTDIDGAGLHGRNRHACARARAPIGSIERSCVGGAARREIWSFEVHGFLDRAPDRF